MRFLIVGAGAAGTTAAQALREKSPQAEITIFTNENYPYYGKPRLPEFLSDQVELEQIYFHNEEWYESNRIFFRNFSASSFWRTALTFSIPPFTLSAAASRFRIRACS